MGGLEIFIGLAVMSVCILAILTRSSIQKKQPGCHFIALMCMASIVVDVAYTASILIRNKLLMSISYSVYSIAISVVVASLTLFVITFTKCWNKTVRKYLMLAIGIFIAIEAVVFLINPFYPTVLEYAEISNGYATFQPDPLSLYKVHLFFDYAGVGLSVILLLHRFIYVPKEYKANYIFIVAAIFSIVILNIGYLIIPVGNTLMNLDISVLGYGIAAMVVYWNAFEYRDGLMVNTFKNTIFESIDEGVVLFDYEGKLLLHNGIAKKLLNGLKFDNNLEESRFALRLGLAGIDHKDEDSYAIQCYLEKPTGIIPIRCYYNCLRNKRGKDIGHLYILDDLIQETDLLTGFHDWDSFNTYVFGNEEICKKGTPIAVCDINGLSIINQMYGNNEGDQRIINLSMILREEFPKTCYFVRGSEAHLIVICHNMDQDQTTTVLQRVRERYDGSMQYAVSVVGHRANLGIIETIRDAERGMQAKKLLDKGSIHSEMLTSLIRALEECDNDTEAHVKRTQEMGEKLGLRIGLSDVEQSNLALLCILHDIGKVGVPLEVLNKPGRLTDAEWKTIQAHAEKGYQIAKSSKDIEPIANMIRYHHERWDGKGYPEGLSQEAIPLLSRIISVVDAYDAMVNDRSYRKALQIDAARNELVRGAGSQFDPHIVSEYLALLQELDADETFDDVPGVYPSQQSENAVTKPVEERPSVEPGQASGQASLAAVPQTSLTKQQEQAMAHVHRMNYCRYMLDDQSSIVEIDAAFERMTGYSMDDIVERKLTQMDLLPEEDLTDYMMMIGEQISKTGRGYCEHRIRCKDGKSIEVFCFGRQFYDPTLREGRSEILVVPIDTTHAVQSLKSQAVSQADSKLRVWEDIAHRDALTGLLNRNGFENQVEMQIVKREYRLLFLMIDLDYFKKFNDTYGHHAGDEYLIHMAKSMKAAVRDRDLLCRIGGDEFAAVLLLPKGFDEEAAYQQVDRIYQSIDESLKEVTGGGGLSMGAMLANSTLRTFHDFYIAADKALYSAKESGRGRYVICGKE